MTALANAEGIEGAHRPGEPEGRANVAERGRRRADCLEWGDVETSPGSVDREDQGAGDEEADVDEPEGQHRPQRSLLDHAVEANRYHFASR